MRLRRIREASKYGKTPSSRLCGQREDSGLALRKRLVQIPDVVEHSFREIWSS
jgi:hypothetical protein